MMYWRISWLLDEEVYQVAVYEVNEKNNEWVDIFIQDCLNGVNPFQSLRVEKLERVEGKRYRPENPYRDKEWEEFCK